MRGFPAFPAMSAIPPILALHAFRVLCAMHAFIALSVFRADIAADAAQPNYIERVLYGFGFHCLQQSAFYWQIRR
jgi:hypothetical protein